MAIQNGHLSEAAKGVQEGVRTPFKGRERCPSSSPRDAPSVLPILLGLQRKHDFWREAALAAEIPWFAQTGSPERLPPHVALLGLHANEDIAQANLTVGNPIVGDITVGILHGPQPSNPPPKPIAPSASSKASFSQLKASSPSTGPGHDRRHSSAMGEQCKKL